MLARKSQLQSNKPAGVVTLERSRLTQARTLAQRRHDFSEVAEIDAQLAELAATSSADRPSNARKDDDMLAKVNERNRRANMEAVRRAELAEADRKRRERKLAAASGGTVVPVDPSARLKTVPRLFNLATPTTTRLVLYLHFLVGSLNPPILYTGRERRICHRLRVRRRGP
jgi:RNA polymerase-associated protein RTF1